MISKNKRHMSFLMVIFLAAAMLSGCGSSAKINQDNGTDKSASDNIKTEDTANKDNENKDTEGKDSLTDTNKQTNERNTDVKKADDTTKNVEPTQSDVKKKNKVIVIDAGHGGTVTSEKEPVAPGSKDMKPKNAVGATGVSTKTPEYVVNLNVALKLEDYLKKDGYTVVMTRTSNSQTVGNIERAEIGNKNNADLVIRIHADSTESSSVTGASMLVPGNIGYAKDIAGISKKYGETIFNTLISEVGMKSRGIITRTDLTGFNWSKVPVVLIEMGFLSNPAEDKLLSSKEYEDKIALGLYKGIQKSIGN